MNLADAAPSSGSGAVSAPAASVIRSRTMPVRTNRDLYLVLTRLGVQRDLETFLRALLRAGRSFGTREPSADEVATMLTTAATGEPEEFDAAWLSRPPPWTGPERPARARWEDALIAQIADLRRMKDNGQLADSERYFGLNAPSGTRWYNFDPASYLECGTSGSVGGWDESSPVELVTPPAVVDDDDLERRSFGWEGFCDLLSCGSCYE